MTTKAIHLELVSNLTSEAFIAALKHFTARRGLIDHLYSDNGTNFVGANRELKEFFKAEEFLRQVHNYAAKTQFQWHFIPPNSPHFGGLWEAGVKSLKYHWRRIVGKALLTFEEFSTLLAQVEACLNSRPLIALSNEPNDDDEPIWAQVIFLLVLHWPPSWARIYQYNNEQLIQMAASSTLQSAVMEKVVSWLLEQLAATQQMAQPATRRPAQNASAALRR